MEFLRTLLISVIDFVKLLVVSFAQAIRELFATMRDLKR